MLTTEINLTIHMTKTKLQLVFYTLLFFGLIALSAVALAAPLGETVNDDANEVPIDTNVSLNEAIDIAKRVLDSVSVLGNPQLQTEDDGQVMWRIPYVTKVGAHNEIVINPATGAYRLILESENGVIETPETRTEDTVSPGTRSTVSDVLSTTTPLGLRGTSTVMTPTLTIERQIIDLLNQVIALLRTQLLQ
jgi:hypothetical protein